VTLTITPVTATIGAEITGIDLAAPLDEADVDRLRTALRDHLVLFFRDQALDPVSHLAFAQHFGEISVAPFGPKAVGHPEVTELDQVAPRDEGADSWHADNTYQPEPPLGSILRAVQLPAVGGDTCFLSTFAAYDALSAPMRSCLDGLTALHDITRMLQKAIEIGRSDADLGELRRRWPPHEHPVVRVQPETGRRGIYVNANWTTRIVGLTERESAALLAMLLDHLREPDFQCRLRWAPGTVAFWDNRYVQHYAVPDYSERRVMQRVMLAGDRPIGPAEWAASMREPVGVVAGTV
jgi:taurine dioxygenase